MLTAKAIAEHKIAGVAAVDIRPGDFVFYIGKKNSKASRFVSETALVDRAEIVMVRIVLDNDEVHILNPTDTVLCVQDESNG